jgi:hypothetical protein
VLKETYDSNYIDFFVSARWVSQVKREQVKDRGNRESEKRVEFFIDT